MKTRTALLVAAIGVFTFLAIEMDKHNRPTQTSSTAATDVARYADGVNEPEPMLVADPAAKQRVIDAELDRAIKRTQDVELNRAIQRALSDGSPNRELLRE